VANITDMVVARPSIPFVSPFVGEEEVEAVVRALRSGRLAQGPEVEAFEREICAVTHARHAVALNSGTAALHAALAAMEVGEGDEVVTTPFTFAATATPVLMVLATVRFADIDPHTYGLDPAAAEAAIGPRTRAVVPVDLFGLPYDARLDGVRARGIRVVEDACQAIGAWRDGAPAGSLGDVAALSFYATKNLTTGEGGMLLTRDAETASRARAFRQHGLDERGECASLGYNYRMPEMCAALGRIQLTRLEAVSARRRANAALYDERLGGIAGITTPFVPTNMRHAYHQYSIAIDGQATPNGADRDRVTAFLGENGIGFGVYYRRPLHLQPLFAAAGYGPGDFPVAERVARQILALPVHPALTRAQADAVVRAVRVAVGADRNGAMHAAR
jgi:perosamine synthetase